MRLKIKLDTVIALSCWIICMSVLQMDECAMHANYIDCYKDNGTRDLNGLGNTGSGLLNTCCNTNEWCIEQCKNRSFTFSGTQFGVECFCGDSYGKYGVNSGDCTMTCSGNATQMCGNRDRNSVHTVCPLGYYTTSCNQECHCDGVQCNIKTGLCLNGTQCAVGWHGTQCNISCDGEFCDQALMNDPLCRCKQQCHCKNNASCDLDTGICPDGNCEPPWTGVQCNRNDYIQNQYIGCYKDNNSVRDLNGTTTSNTSMTIHKCLETCRLSNFTYAGLQFGSECHCGNTYGNYGNSSSCNMTCPGNVSTICGAAGANSIYAACPVGYYGRYCDKLCQCKDQHPCSLITGKCPTQICAESWSGTTCDVETEQEYTTEGCFLDHETVQYLYNISSLTIDICVDDCRINFGEYAGLQNGNMCMCGFKGYDEYGAGTCNTTCSGSIDMCGGLDSNSVYSVCPIGYFGALCGRVCFCQNTAEDCDMRYGNCSSGCAAKKKKVPTASLS